MIGQIGAMRPWPDLDSRVNRVGPRPISGFEGQFSGSMPGNLDIRERQALETAADALLAASGNETLATPSDLRGYDRERRPSIEGDPTIGERNPKGGRPYASYGGTIEVPYLEPSGQWSTRRLDPAATARVIAAGQRFEPAPRGAEGFLISGGPTIRGSYLSTSDPRDESSLKALPVQVSSGRVVPRARRLSYVGGAPPVVAARGRVLANPDATAAWEREYPEPLAEAIQGLMDEYKTPVVPLEIEADPSRFQVLDQKAVAVDVIQRARKTNNTPNEQGRTSFVTPRQLDAAVRAGWELQAPDELGVIRGRRADQSEFVLVPETVLGAGNVNTGVPTGRYILRTPQDLASIGAGAQVRVLTANSEPGRVTALTGLPKIGGDVQAMPVQSQPLKVMRETWVPAFPYGPADEPAGYRLGSKLPRLPEIFDAIARTISLDGRPITGANFGVAPLSPNPALRKQGESLDLAALFPKMSPERRGQIVTRPYELLDALQSQVGAEPEVMPPLAVGRALQAALTDPSGLSMVRPELVTGSSATQLERVRQLLAEAAARPEPAVAVQLQIPDPMAAPRVPGTKAVGGPLGWIRRASHRRGAPFAPAPEAAVPSSEIRPGLTDRVIPVASGQMELPGVIVSPPGGLLAGDDVQARAVALMNDGDFWASVSDATGDTGDYNKGFAIASPENAYRGAGGVNAAQADFRGSAAEAMSPDIDLLSRIAQNQFRIRDPFQAEYVAEQAMLNAAQRARTEGRLPSTSDNVRALWDLAAAPVRTSQLHWPEGAVSPAAVPVRPSALMPIGRPGEVISEVGVGMEPSLVQSVSPQEFAPRGWRELVADTDQGYRTTYLRSLLDAGAADAGVDQREWLQSLPAAPSTVAGPRFVTSIPTRRPGAGARTYYPWIPRVGPMPR